MSNCTDDAAAAFMQTPQYKEWETRLVSAGRTVEAVVVTPLVTLPNGTPFMAALKPRIRVADEARVKENETVVMRPWVSAVVVWARGPTYGGDRFLLVAEFRSSVNNRVGTVIEVPGGSSTDARAGRAPRTVRGGGPARR
jgi:hypothetical protein